MAFPPPSDTAPRSPDDVATLQRYARAAGVALLLSIIFGALGEMYLPGKIVVNGDAAATAANNIAHPTLFRLTFASYLVEGICDVALCVFFYILLKPVDRNLALLSAFFGLVSMITYATSESSFFAAALVLRDTGNAGLFGRAAASPCPPVHETLIDDRDAVPVHVRHCDDAARLPHRALAVSAQSARHPVRDWRCGVFPAIGDVSRCTGIELTVAGCANDPRHASDDGVAARPWYRRLGGTAKRCR